jgi:uncharacterized OB-fold protein
MNRDSITIIEYHKKDTGYIQPCHRDSSYVRPHKNICPFCGVTTKITEFMVKGKLLVKVMQPTKGKATIEILA